MVEAIEDRRVTEQLSAERRELATLPALCPAERPELATHPLSWQALCRSPLRPDLKVAPLLEDGERRRSCATAARNQHSFAEALVSAPRDGFHSMPQQLTDFKRGQAEGVDKINLGTWLVMDACRPREMGSKSAYAQQTAAPAAPQASVSTSASVGGAAGNGAASSSAAGGRSEGGGAGWASSPVCPCGGHDSSHAMTQPYTSDHGFSPFFFS